MPIKEEQRRNTPFGLQLMLDIYDCPLAVLNDQALVSDILHSLPGELGMRILVEPVVVFAEPNGMRDPGGWSGFVMIHESHISIHTFIKRRFVTIDVYSCKEFDTSAAIDYFKRSFQSTDIESSIEVRGKKYPRRNIG